MRLEGLRVLGSPYEYATRYDSENIDEIIYLDIVASLYGRNNLHSLIEKTVADVFCPVTVGGGIQSIEDARALFLSGADKIALNTASVRRPDLINELANKFGSQAVVLQLDAKKSNGSWQAWTDGGREPSGRDAIEWSREAVSRGAGEILLTSIDREGTNSGFDVDLIKEVSKIVSVPVVASGGMGNSQHAFAALDSGAWGVASAGVLHRGGSVQTIKAEIASFGIPMRL